MTVSPPRTMLPIAWHARGKRSALTCALKCGNQCLHAVPNTSDNEYFPEVVARALSRRGALGAAGAGALGLMLAQSALEQGAGSRGLAFRPIAPVAATVDAVTVPAGWTWSPIIRWGDPLFADSPAFDPNNQSVTSQASQFGYNNDYLAIIHTPGSGGRRGLLCANHEYTNENIMFAPTTDAAELAEQRRIAMMAHGFSVVLRTWRAPEPSHHREHTVCARWPRRGPPLAAHGGRPAGPAGARHPEQLRRKHHAVGDDLVGRGELQPVLHR